MPYTRISFRILLVLLVVAIFKAQAAPNQAVDRSGSALSSKRLMKELKAVRETDSYKNGVFTVELVDDNIYEWHVKLFKFDPESKLHKSLQQWRENGGKDHILLHVVYGADYPFSPPMVRVVYPYIVGHGVLDRGNICSELLTHNGWSTAYTIEPLMLQVAATIAGDEIYPDFDITRYYTIQDAQFSHDQLVSARKHKWSLDTKKKS
uniref:Ubiquitin-conjugating enzyme E2 Q2 n=1 Tax=Aceria tosichella TaxID=561515 RepID=A0A6G1S924_9ACAR